ncbi:HXXEE domain-containing protein, partial [Actinoplanes sp. NPDC026623]|uniref:HXXEE domain-containing protein n=1 Tax=Actinoplanes sp. NPDC026623 TaxID=3155610 RepID=UPI0033EB6A21
MGPKAIAAGLFVAWAVHDLEEILGTAYWRDTVVPRLRERHPRVPAVTWRAARIGTDQMAVAVGLIAVPVAVATAYGVATDGRSPLFRATLAAYGIHGVGHVAGSLLARDYTPGVLTSPLPVHRKQDDHRRHGAHGDSLTWSSFVGPRVIRR